MSKKDWEELLSWPEFANLPDWKYKIILEKIIDPAEVACSEAVVSEGVAPEIASTLEATLYVPMALRSPRPKPSTAKEKQKKPQVVLVR